MYHIFYRQDFHTITFDYNFVIYLCTYLFFKNHLPWCWYACITQCLECTLISPVMKITSYRRQEAVFIVKGVFKCEGNLQSQWDDLYLNVPGACTSNCVVSLVEKSEETSFVLVLKVVLDITVWGDKTNLCNMWRKWVKELQ